MFVFALAWLAQHQKRWVVLAAGTALTAAGTGISVAGFSTHQPLISRTGVLTTSRPSSSPSPPSAPGIPGRATTRPTKPMVTVTKTTRHPQPPRRSNRIHGDQMARGPRCPSAVIRRFEPPDIAAGGAGCGDGDADLDGDRVSAGSGGRQGLDPVAVEQDVDLAEPGPEPDADRRR